MRQISDILARRGREAPAKGSEASERETCLFCNSTLKDNVAYGRHRVCPQCHFHYSVTARERVQQLADPGSFKETHRSLISLDPLSFSSQVSYRRRLFSDQRRTGLTEAAVTGSATIGGLATALVVLDFGFMGGSMGSAVGEKVALAFEMAARRKMPLIAVVTSGGTRLQEGPLSMMQMAKTSVAAARFHQKGLPYICVMANPTSGQVYTSFASLADITVAETGALIGFESLRGMEEATNSPVPAGAHTAEAQLAHGSLDFVIDREDLKETLETLLDLLHHRYSLKPEGKVRRSHRIEEPATKPAWGKVELARHARRPSGKEFIERMVSNYVELHGDRVYGDDPSVIVAVGSLGGQGVVFVGHDRRHGDGQPLPEGFRKAQRGMKLAAKFKLPVITLIDTPGANASLESEQRGIGQAVASTMATMAELPVPSIAVVLGEGGNEAAIAFGVADRIIMMENAILSPISPEGAAALLYRDPSRANEVAESLRLTAADCTELGIVDGVVPETDDGAHADPAAAARHLERALLHNLSLLEQQKIKQLLKDRYKKFRRMGEYSSRFKALMVKEAELLSGYLANKVRRARHRKEEELEDEEEGIPE